MLQITFRYAAIILLLSYSASAFFSAGSVKGEWAAVFSIAGHTAEATLTFDVSGTKLTGTMSSEHTGPGTVADGTFDNNKLICTVEFEKHESIVVKGDLADDKLSGTFETEGMSGTWTAVRKK